MNAAAKLARKTRKADARAEAAYVLRVALAAQAAYVARKAVRIDASLAGRSSGERVYQGVGDRRPAARASVDGARDSGPVQDTGARV